MKHKILMTLVLLMTVATGAWADIAQGDVFMFGSYIDFGTSVKCKLSSGGTDDYTVAKSTKLPLTYGGYENGKHQLVFKSADATSYLYIVDTNSAKPWGIKVIGGDGTNDNPFTFSTVYDWPNNCPQELIIGTDGTCSFDMPASDATVDYDIVRDMAVQMTTTVGGVTDNSDYRIRLKKDGNKWALADLTVDQVMALFKVHDAIENKDLAFSGDGAVCAISIYAIDDNDQPTGDAVAFADLEPGRYVAIATAKDGTAYDGTTDKSNVIVLFQGYEVTVPSKEFVTYYKDEPLYADTESADAELYTITSVSGDKAVLSSAITTAPSNTPLLIYNPTGETKKFLLIPATAEPNLALTVAPEFIGTTEATTIPASTDGLNNYAFNGKKFIWVMEALPVAANKAWLAIPTELNARTINLVFDDGNATGLDGVTRTAEQNGDYYDLNGRKLDKKPTRKGVYIQNGRKVVIK